VSCLAYELTVEEVMALEGLGISHQLYAGILAAAEVVLLTWAALGILIFWRRSNDWIGLLVLLFFIFPDGKVHVQLPTVVMDSDLSQEASIE